MHPKDLTIAKAPPAVLPISDSTLTWLSLIIIFALSIGSRLWLGTDTDVSWMITVNEKLLAGGRLYVDAMETNPPAAVFIYMPPVALAKAFGLRPEWVVDAYVYVLAGLSLWPSAGILRGTAFADRTNMLGFGLASVAILLVLPVVAFGQREHIAVMALLPILLLTARRIEGLDCSPLFCLLAGLIAGVGMAIKPHFAAPIALAMFTGALWTRRLGPIFGLEAWVAGVFVVAYGVATWLVYPEFFTEMVPMMRDVYAPNRPAWYLMIQQPGTVFFPALLAIVFVLRKPGLSSGALVLIAGSVGGGLSYWVQGKGYPYHGYPMVALGLLAAAALVFSDNLKSLQTKRERAMVCLLIVGFALANAGWFARLNRPIDYSQLLAGLEPHPKMVLMGNNMGITHPLVRDIGGRWVSRMPAMLATTNVLDLRKAGGLSAKQLAELEHYESREVGILREDICRGIPDLIFAATWYQDFVKWAAGRPELTPVLAAYRRAVETPAGPVFQIESRERLSAACR